MSTLPPWSEIHVPLPLCEEMTPSEIADVMVSCERILREVTAAHARLIQAIGANGRDTAACISRTTGVSRGEAYRRKRIAEAIEAFPLAGQLLHDGLISVEHVLTLREVIGQPGAERLVALAVGTEPKAFRDLITRFQIGDGPLDDEKMHQRQRALRSVTFSSAPGGMLAMRAVLTPTDGAKVRAAIEARCVRTSRTGPLEPLERRMADALVACFSSTGGTGASGTRPTVVLTLDLRSGEAEIIGQGPITNAEARKVLLNTPSFDVYAARLGPHGNVHDGRITKHSSLLNLARLAGVDGVHSIRDRVARLLDTIDPNALDSRPNSRDPTPAQRIAIILRDRHCVISGCTADHTRSEAHHLIEWERGGATIVDNLAIVCRAHHHWLHKNGLAIIRGPNNSYALTSAHSGNEPAA